MNSQSNAVPSAALPSILVDRKALAAAVDKAASVVERRNTYPILANVRLRGDGKALFATATDLDIDVHIVVPAAADSDFDVTVPALLLKQLLRGAPPSDMVAFTSPSWAPAVPGEVSTGNIGVIDFETTKTQVACLPPASFPERAAGKFSHHFTMSGAALVEALSAVGFAISNEETRYYLNGVYMHSVVTGSARTLRTVATDGHRMARFDSEVPDGAWAMPGVILPRKLVDTLLKLIKGKKCPAEIAVDIGDARVRFQFGDTTIVSKVIEGTFPDYDRVTPKNNAKLLHVNTASLSQAVTSVSKIASERGGKAVKLDVTEGKLALSVTHPDHGTATMDIEADTSGFIVQPFVSFEHFEIGFNARYLLDIIAHVESDRLTMAFNDAGSPTVFKGEGERLYVLMPMRV